MFKLFSKIFLYPMLVKLITKYASKSVEGILLINLGNVLLFSGIALFIFAQAVGWVFLAQPVMSSALGAVAMVAMDRETGAVKMVTQEQAAVMDALNRYQYAPVIVQQQQIGFELTTWRMLAYATILTGCVLYGMMVAAGYGNPFTLLAKSAVTPPRPATDDLIIETPKLASTVATVIKESAIEQNVEIAESVVKKMSEKVSETMTEKVIEEVVKSAPLVAKAEKIDAIAHVAKATINGHPVGSWVTTIVGFCAAGFVVQNMDKIHKGGELALAVAKVFMPKTALAAKMVGFAASYLIRLTPLGSIMPMVSANDGAENEVEIFKSRFEKYGELIDKDYDEIIEYFIREKKRKGSL